MRWRRRQGDPPLKDGPGSLECEVQIIEFGGASIENSVPRMSSCIDGCIMARQSTHC